MVEQLLLKFVRIFCQTALYSVVDVLCCDWLQYSSYILIINNNVWNLLVNIGRKSTKQLRWCKYITSWIHKVPYKSCFHWRSRSSVNIIKDCKTLTTTSNIHAKNSQICRYNTTYALYKRTQIHYFFRYMLTYFYKKKQNKRRALFNLMSNIFNQPYK